VPDMPTFLLLCVQLTATHVARGVWNKVTFR